MFLVYVIALLFVSPLQASMQVSDESSGSGRASHDIASPEATSGVLRDVQKSIESELHVNRDEEQDFPRELVDLIDAYNPVLPRIAAAHFQHASKVPISKLKNDSDTTSCDVVGNRWYRQWRVHPDKTHGAFAIGDISSGEPLTHGRGTAELNHDATQVVHSEDWRTTSYVYPIPETLKTYRQIDLIPGGMIALLTPDELINDTKSFFSGGAPVGSINHFARRSFQHQSVRDQFLNEAQQDGIQPDSASIARLAGCFPTQNNWFFISHPDAQRSITHIVCFDKTTKNITWQHTKTAPMNFCSVSDDGHHLEMSYEDGIRAVAIATGDEVFSLFNGHALDAADKEHRRWVFGREGNIIGVGENSLVILPTISGMRKKSIHEILNPPHPVPKVAPAKHIVTARHDWTRSRSLADGNSCVIS